MKAANMIRFSLVALVAALLLSESVAHAQTTTAPPLTSFFRPDSVKWQQWEAAVPGGKRSYLERLGICVDRFGMTESHHVLDFTGDGLLDLVYSGSSRDCVSAPEGTSTVLYQNRRGKLTVIADLPGEITRIWRPVPWQPVWLEVTYEGCCGDVYVQRTWHAPVWRGDTLTYVESASLLYTYSTKFPARYFTAARPFRVSQEQYKLRVTPGVDDTSDKHLDVDSGGNAVEVYGRGATGIALADTTDGTGRTWWFVLMEPVSRRPADEHRGKSGRRRVPLVYHVGWMSSRFLEPAETTAIRPITTRWATPRDSTRE